MLKHGSPDKIREMFHKMREETRGLLKSIISLVYFMRGSIQYKDMLLMTPGERELINDFIAQRMEQEQNHIHPVY